MYRIENREGSRLVREMFVAAMADEACFVHTAPGGNLEQLKAQVTQWGIPVLRI